MEIWGVYITCFHVMFINIHCPFQIHLLKKQLTTRYKMAKEKHHNILDGYLIAA